MGIAMSTEDKKWRRESDLRILKEANEIKGDSGRLAGAQREAKEQAAALKGVAGVGGGEVSTLKDGYRKIG